jgi:hypothetical protein
MNNEHQLADSSSVVEPKPVSQEQNLFALAELVRVPELDLDPNTTENEFFKKVKHK